MKTAILNNAEILAALRDCYAPDLPLNIVDLGLVESIAITSDPNAPGAGIPGVPPRCRVRITLLLNGYADAETSPIPALVSNRLAAFQTISRTEVLLLDQPPWTPERMSPEGRQRFALHLTSRKPAHALVTIQTGQTKT